MFVQNIFCTMFLAHLRLNLFELYWTVLEKYLSLKTKQEKFNLLLARDKLSKNKIFNEFKLNLMT